MTCRTVLIVLAASAVPTLHAEPAPRQEVNTGLTRMEEPGPQDFSELKAILNGYLAEGASAPLLARFEAAFVQGSKEQQTLREFFEVPSNKRYRAAIADILRQCTSHKFETAEFLAWQIENGDGFTSEDWVPTAIAFLVEMEHPSAHQMVLELAGNSDEEHQGVAVNLLAKIGLEEDLRPLQSLVEKRRIGGFDPAADELQKQGHAVIDQISARVAGRPPSYKTVKAELDGYARRICPMPDSREKHAALAAKGAESQRALTALFGDYFDPQYRAVIVQLFRDGTGNKKEAGDFLFGKLPTDPGAWPETSWPCSTVEFLVEASHPRAREVVLTALQVDRGIVLNTAVNCLARVGTKEDIPALQRVIDQRKAKGIKLENDPIQQRAQAVIGAITDK